MVQQHNNSTVVKKEKHEFALFVESLSLLIAGKGPGSNVIFSDEKLVHRMMNVVRLCVNDYCVFFDQNIQILAMITAFSGKKQISVAIRSLQKNIPLQPTVTFLLPLLKRDDYEQALYALTEVGVNTIQLVFTQKTAHQWSGDRDNERAQRILIAAAEQSKNFAYPQIKEPISLEAAVKKYDAMAAVKIFFDPQGKRFFDVAKIVHGTKADHVVLLVGPEGDLSSQEKEMVQINDFIFCALTPTVMRAVQAAALGAGFIRSLLASTTY